MALLLNATLMSHTSAMFCVLLFMYAYWRMERGWRRERGRLVLWGVVAGVALGLVIASRLLTGVSVAIPFIAWSIAQLLRVIRNRVELWRRLRPLLALSLFALLFTALVPLYNDLATGNPTKNLYTLVWWYDIPGFGECCGRAADRGEGGHDVTRGIRMMRFDLSLTAADLFGWQWGALNDDAREHLLNEADYYPQIGLSWLLLPFGLIVAFKRKTPWVIVWLAVGFGWLLFIMRYQNGALGDDPTWSYFWLGIALIWMVLPLFVTGRARDSVRITWSWLLVAVTLSILLLQLTYWIGSQRYSTRYYFEALPAVAILSALPVAWLARRVGRTLVYVVFTGVLLYSLYMYSIPRIDVLHGYNFIDSQVLQGVEARREGDQPVLVIVSGSNVRWRALGELMSVTSPFLDSDIVGAWDYGGARAQLIAMFPDRQVIDMQAEDNEAWFSDEERPLG
jgi:hypothetical protein